MRAVLAVVVCGAALLGWGTTTAQAGNAAECPPELKCRFVPTPESRYDVTERPGNGMDIKYIVIHDTETPFDDTIKFFKGPKGASAHYLLRSRDGAVVQLVPTKDVAYHSGNFTYNMHSIGVEHEGFVREGPRWYTDAMYRASAKLVRYLAARYEIPLDRDHILAHEEVPPPTLERLRTMHTDPGPYWNWDRYFELLGAPLQNKNGPVPKPVGQFPAVVMLVPRFADNKRPFKPCGDGMCADLPLRPSNAVYLRSGPSFDAPLFYDPVLRPKGPPGTTGIEDLSARALSGQRFVAVTRLGEWTAIWFAGQLAWFNDPEGTVGRVAPGTTVVPRRASVPIYGAAFPLPGEYPDGVEPSEIEELPYRLVAGQSYVALSVRNADDIGSLIDEDGAKERVYVPGTRQLVEISFNHRRAFVDLADVLLVQ